MVEIGKRILKKIQAWDIKIEIDTEIVTLVVEGLATIAIRRVI